MINLNEYILLPKAERQKHIDLSAPCLERGGNSTNHKGVLAQYLDSNIPKGRILLCHACGNEKCSNPNHLYWGTDRENIVEDGAKFGTWKTPWERMVEKHGYEKACSLNSRKMQENTNGCGNKDKPKAEEHKRKISDAINEMYNKKKEEGTSLSNGGRPRATPYEELIKTVKEKGFKESAKELGLSLAALKGRYYNAVKALKAPVS